MTTSTKKKAAKAEKATAAAPKPAKAAAAKSAKPAAKTSKAKPAAVVETAATAGPLGDTPLAPETAPAPGSRHQAAPERTEVITVAGLQQRLSELGYYHGMWDGHFGQLTAQAVGHFQYRHGLHPNGEPNRETLVALGFKP